MTGRDHTISQLTTDPWIYMLAILIGLAVLFFCATQRVQADLPASSAFDASAKETETMSVDHKIPDIQFNFRAWYGDYSDISNERAGKYPESLNPTRLKGTVQNEGRRSLLGNIMGFFKSFIVGSPTDSTPNAPPAFVSP